MVVKGLSYPSIHSLLVVLLNTIFYIFISIGIYQVIADLVENLGHIVIAAKKVVENVLRSQLLDIVCMINEVVKEAYVRSDRIVIWGIWTHFIGYHVQELGLREVINGYWGKFQVAKEEVGFERNVSQETRSTRFEIDPGSFKLLDVSKRLPNAPLYAFFPSATEPPLSSLRRRRRLSFFLRLLLLFGLTLA